MTNCSNTVMGSPLQSVDTDQKQSAGVPVTVTLLLQLYSKSEHVPLQCKAIVNAT